MSLDSRIHESPPVRSADELARWFAERERPRDAWKVGLEHEKLAVRAGTTAPVAYEGEAGIAALLRAFSRYGYEPFEEEGRVIAAQKSGLTVSIEPGGQLELSGRPFADVHVVAAELERHLAKCHALAEALGLEFLAAGYRPWGTPATAPWMPKNRYRVMRPFLAARGRLAPDMMAMTASAQASFDFSSPRDMGEKLRVALAIQPAVTALFANSPIVNGREAGWKSYRVAVWEEVDPARQGLLAFAFEPGFLDDPYRRYVEWALDVPMIFLRRRGAYLETGGRTFRAFLESGLDGERPTLADWEDHLTTLFPEVRVKGVVEVRAADACDAEMTNALIAFWKGILYDREARASAWEAVKGLALADRRAAMIAAGREGLAGRLADGRTLGELARALLEASALGLCRQHCCGQRGEDERSWLAPLQERAASGRSPADDALDAFRRGGDRALAARLRVA
ncbi:glutamate--cysteine ligase [Anaeromyxobacter oryzisoli]|uniref:glutamate--cysteine ligase n=1 Tax=Anaeromyxobacter oryzisoli TaxID=2925408 RepID=UPI001F59244B|nr:glutamate-cysteine ligase family protein [Anaeromyxobacter sp. SG63]